MCAGHIYYQWKWSFNWKNLFVFSSLKWNLQVFAFFVNLLFLGQAFTIMLVYVWSRRNPFIRMNFFGILNFLAPYLPWALLGFSVILGNTIWWVTMTINFYAYQLLSIFINTSIQIIISYFEQGWFDGNGRWSCLLFFGGCLPKTTWWFSNSKNTTLSVRFVFLFKLFCFFFQS